jgi:hypothetical protein
LNRASSRALKGRPLRPPCAFHTPTWLVYWVGRGVAKPLVELFGRAFVELRTELHTELLQSFHGARCFEVRHVDSATTYRARFCF